MFRLFGALADPLRLRIVEQLANGEYAVGHLAAELDCPQPTLSKALRVLRDADLVSVRVAGRLRYYSLRSRPFDDLVHWASRRAGSTRAEHG